MEIATIDNSATKWPPQAFRQALGHFCSGVVIATGMEDGQPCGLTCQSFISLSLEPPLIAFSPALTSSSYARIRRSATFCINILADDQIDLCRHFATRHPDKFAGRAWTPGPSGNPILDGVLAWIDCEIDQEIEAGDHWLVIAKVRDFATAEGQPLLFYKGDFGGFAAQ